MQSQAESFARWRPQRMQRIEWSSAKFEFTKFEERGGAKTSACQERYCCPNRPRLNATTQYNYKKKNL